MLTVARGFSRRVDHIESDRLRALPLEREYCRNEPRDLYDLWHLTLEGGVDLAALVPELEDKLAFRGRTRAALTSEFAAKEARYAKLWVTRLEPQMASLPPFEQVFRAVRRCLREAGLIER